VNDQYFSSKIFFKQYYFVNISHPHHDYMLEKIDEESLINSIKRDSEGGHSNLVIFTEGAGKIIPQIPVPRAPGWNSLYIRNSQLFDFESGRSLYCDRRVNVAILVSQLTEIIMKELFFSLKINVVANKVIVISCRNYISECVVLLYEEGFNDDLIKSICDPTGEHRRQVENILRLMKCVYIRRAYRYRPIPIPTNNIYSLCDYFLVKKVREMGFAGDRYYLPYPDAKSSSKFYHHEVLYFIKSVFY